MHFDPVASDLAKIFDFSGKNVLITGATGGIGKAMAEAFYKTGAFLCLSGRNEKALTTLQKQYGEKRCRIWPLDLGDKKAVQETFLAITQAHHHIDILINNGGATRDNLFIRMTDEEWQHILDVNLSSAFYLCRAAGKSMIKHKSGVIINISSVIGISGNGGQANYAAAKAGLMAMGKSMAREMASRNIRVNTIAPGYIETPMTEKLASNKEVSEKILDTIPMNRYGSPEDVAGAALFLASPLASYMTGQTLHVNGGMVMV